MTNKPDSKKRLKLWMVISVVATIVICCGGTYLYFAAQAAKTYSVPLVVNAKGLDTEKGTKIPVQTTGKDSKGNDVDDVFYEESNSFDIALRPGNYNVAVEASPIAEDDTIYNTKRTATKVSVAEDGKATVEKEITIKPIPAEEVTDEQIDLAYKTAKGSGIDISKLDKLKERAKKRRDDAIAKKAEEEKRAADEKAADETRKAENNRTATQRGHFLVTDYFYVDVLPNYWDPSNWSVKQIDNHTWEIWRKHGNIYDGMIRISVAKKNPWPCDREHSLGSTGTGMNVYVGGGAGEGITKYLKIELTKTWNPDDPNSIRADGFSNAEHQELEKARERLKKEQTGGN